MNSNNDPEAALNLLNGEISSKVKRAKDKNEMC